MNTIDKIYEYTQNIKKSDFICTLIPVNSMEEVNEHLKSLRKKYYDATHNCYSYILTDKDNNSIVKASDDGEPSQTAGVVILDVLQKNELTNVLAVVTRYFGGIKLGAGGLVRAYTKSVTEALVNTEIIEIKKGYKITIEFDYEQVKYIDNLLKNNIILNKEFNDKIIYTFLIEETDLEKLNNLNIKHKENILF